MSENPKADYWYNEFKLAEESLTNIKRVLLRINVWDGDQQYKDGVSEIYGLIENHFKAQAKRHEDHLHALNKSKSTENP